MFLKPLNLILFQNSVCYNVLFFFINIIKYNWRIMTYNRVKKLTSRTEELSVKMGSIKTWEDPVAARRPNKCLFLKYRSIYNIGRVEQFKYIETFLMKNNVRCIEDKSENTNGIGKYFFRLAKPLGSPPPITRPKETTLCFFDTINNGDLRKTIESRFVVV